MENKTYKALEILKIFNKDNIQFNTSLYDTDYNEIIVKKSLFNLFDNKKVIITEDFANAVINFDNLRFYFNMFYKYYNRISNSETGLLFLETKQNINKQDLNEIKFLIKLIKMAINIFLQKKDTALFRDNVQKMNNIFSNELILEPLGDYGVIYCYSIETKPIFLNESINFLKQFLNQIKSQLFKPDYNLIQLN